MDQEPSVDNAIYDAEIRLGNFCNLRCIMCYPGASSSIAAERFTHRQKFASIGLAPNKDAQGNYVRPELDAWWERPDFLEFIEIALKDARRVNVTGGEPFIIPEVIKILDHLWHKRDTVLLSFNTNMTKLGDDLLQKLQGFSNLHVFVSLEGAGPHNDYLRYPSQWQDISDNIERLARSAPRAEIKVNHTFQHASAYSLPALAAFCAQRGLEMSMTMAQGQAYMGLNSVPPADLKTFLQWAENTTDLDRYRRNFVVNAIKNAAFDADLYGQFQDYVAVLDDVRGTDYRSVFNPSAVT